MKCVRKGKWFVKVESDIAGCLSIPPEVNVGAGCSVHGVGDTAVSSTEDAVPRTTLCVYAQDLSHYITCSMILQNILSVEHISRIIRTIEQYDTIYM